MRLSIALALAVILGVGSAPVLAQPDESRKGEAVALIKEGDKHFRRGEYHERRKRTEKAAEEYQAALAKYEAAFDAYPSPKIYFPIAQAEAKLGRYLDAIRHYRQLLEEADDLNEQAREEALDRLDEAMQHVAVLVLVVSPQGANITIDGEARGQAPAVEPFVLPPGEHTIAVTAEGYAPYETTLVFEPGDQSQRTIDLEKIPVVVKKPRPRTPPPEPELPSIDRRPLYLGIGATAALATAATITGLVAVSKHGTFGDTSLPEADRQAARDSGKTYAVVTDLLWLAAIGSGAYTTYYYFKRHKPAQEALEREQRPRTSDLWLAPYGDADRLGVAIGGRF